MSQSINHNIIMLQRSYSEVCKQTTVYTWEENKQMTIHSVHVYRVLVSSWGRVLPQTAVPTHSWSPHKARQDMQQVCLSHYWSISAARHTLSQGTGWDVLVHPGNQAGWHGNNTGGVKLVFQESAALEEQPSSWRSQSRITMIRLSQYHNIKKFSDARWKQILIWTVRQVLSAMKLQGY